MSLNKLGIWGNTEKKIFWDIFPKILSWADKNKLQPYITKRISGKVSSNFQIINSKNDFNKVDFMLALGGDGTFLSLARIIENNEIPILGVHLGDLGFLAKVTLKDLFYRLDQVVAGDYFVEDRALIKTKIKKGDKHIKYVSLNDFVFANV